MFAGFSLTKRLENVSLGNGDSRVLYTATQDCFVVITAKQFSPPSYNLFTGPGGIANPGLRGAMIANTHTTRNLVNPSGLTSGGGGVNFPMTPNISFLPSGKNLEWISTPFVSWVVDIDILTSGNP